MPPRAARQAPRDQALVDLLRQQKVRGPKKRTISNTKIGFKTPFLPRVFGLPTDPTWHGDLPPLFLGCAGHSCWVCRICGPKTGPFFDPKFGSAFFRTECRLLRALQLIYSCAGPNFGPEYGPSESRRGPKSGP